MATRAFTLIELLCTTAVMLLIFGILFQISGNVLKVSTMSRQEMDANQRTRAVLDSLEADLKNMVNQYGATVLVTTATNNTQLTFLAYNRGPGVSGTSNRYVAVSYWLDTSSGHLMRSYNPILWSSTANPIFTASNFATSGSTASAATTSGTSVIADSILQFKAVVVLDSGTVSPIVSSTSTSWLSSTSPDGTTYGNSLYGLTLTGTTSPLVRSITVGVAALDSKTYRLCATTGGGIPFITSKLNTSGTVSPVDALTPYGMWSQAVTNGSLVDHAIPKPFVTALRMAQNTFRLK